MKLEWIKAVKCDQCGETEVVEEGISFSSVLNKLKDSEHRRFKCGRQVENRRFRDEFYYTCKQSAGYKDFNRRMEKIKVDMRIMLAGTGLKKEVIETIVNHLECDVYMSSFTEGS